MKVEKKVLVDALNTVLPAVNKKGDDETVNRLVFTGYDVVGYNDQFCIVHPLAVDFASTVPSEETSKIVARITAKEVDLVYSKEQLNIKGGKIKSRLKTEPENPLGVWANDVVVAAGADTLEWYGLPEDFMEAIKLCMYSASTDPTEKHLQCVYIDEGLVVGSDDFRISEYLMGSAMAHKLLIPATVCMELVKLGGFTEYTVDDTWVFFNREDNVMLACRLGGVEYDDYARFFEMDGTTLTLPAKEIAGELGSVALMAEGESDLEKEVRVTIDDKKVVLRGEKALGWLEATIKKGAEGAVQPISFGVNPTFLANILQITQTVNVGTDRALFTDPEGKFRHLISLGIL